MFAVPVEIRRFHRFKESNPSDFLRGTKRAVSTAQKRPQSVVSKNYSGPTLPPPTGNEVDDSVGIQIRSAQNRHLSFGYTHGSVYILRVFRFAEGAITLAEQHQCGPAIIGIKRLVCEQVGDTVSVYVGYSRQEAIRQRDWHSKVPGSIA